MQTKVMPFIFYNKNCPVCGAKQSIKFSDILGYKYDKINSVPDGVYETKCNKCGFIYTILWDVNGNPSLADKNLSIKEFESDYINNEKRNIDDILFEDI